MLWTLENNEPLLETHVGPETIPGKESNQIIAPSEVNAISDALGFVRTRLQEHGARIGAVEAAGGALSLKKDFGAVGNGIADDSLPVQNALTAIVAAGGGALDFGDGIYRIGTIRSGWAALQMSFVNGANTRPVALVGRGAILKHDADPTKVLLSIAGRPAGYTDNSAPSYNLRGLFVSGIEFVGTRVPNDTDINTANTNTLLYLTDVEDVRVSGNTFRNGNSAGIYYFVRRAIFSENTFHNVNGGIQGNGSREVVIANNAFRCDVKCDDQIGIFGSTTTTGSAGVVISGNVVNKGFDGLKNSGGTRRGWARCAVIWGNVNGVTVQGNEFLDSGSADPADSESSASMGGLIIHGGGIADPTAGPRNIRVLGNLFRNLRWGIKSTAAGTVNLTIEGNTFTSIAEEAIRLDGTSNTESHRNLKIEGNTFHDIRSSTVANLHVVQLYNLGVARIAGNKWSACFGDAMLAVLPVPDGGYTYLHKRVTIESNTVELDPVANHAPSSYVFRIKAANWTRVVRNSISAKYARHVYLHDRGDFAEISDNVFDGFDVAGNHSFLANSVAADKVGAFVSRGNLTREESQSWTGRNLWPKMPLGSGTPLASGNLPTWQDGAGPVTVIGTAAPTAGAWVVGDRVINAAPAVGQPRDWICTAAGSPGAWVAGPNL